MAFPRSLRIVRDQAEIASAASQAVAGPVPHVREAGALLAAISQAYGVNVPMNTAMQVPAFAKAVKTYAHTISAFPLREYLDDVPVTSRPLLADPSKYLPYGAVMTRLVIDLLCYDRAYWYVDPADRSDVSTGRRPTSITPMRVQDVQDASSDVTGTDPGAMPPAATIYWMGRAIPARDVIKFYGDGMGGWLKVGATAVNTAAMLEAATARYSETPIPSTVLKNMGADLPAAQVDDLLEAWESARANRSTAYLNSVIDVDTMGWNARDLQLVEARNASAISIARLANLDPVWVGAGVEGSAVTYSNRVDLYRQLLDVSLTPVMDLISERLSKDDITPRGHSVKFDTSVFLRANSQELATMIATLLPLEVMDREEARELLDLPYMEDNDEDD